MSFPLISIRISSYQTNYFEMQKACLKMICNLNFDKIMYSLLVSTTITQIILMIIIFWSITMIRILKLKVIYVCI